MPMREKKWSGTLATFLKENFLSLILFVAVLVILFYGLNSAQQGSDQEGLRIAEESVARAVVSCYAIEGAYPESFDYLKENYNLYIDEDKYSVQYMVFASNIMPTVTIIEVGS